jgi:hypothetical protein
MMYFGELDYLMVFFADFKGIPRFSRHIFRSQQNVSASFKSATVLTCQVTSKLYASLNFPYWSYSATYLTPLGEAVTQE